MDADKLTALNINTCKLSIGQEVVAVDPRYFRPTEVDLLIGDATKARTKLGWSPRHTLADLVRDMMNSDLQLMQKQLFLEQGGYDTLKQHE